MARTSWIPCGFLSQSTCLPFFQTCSLVLTTGALNVSPKVDELLLGSVADQLSSRLLGLAQELYDLFLDDLEDMSYMALLSCAVTCKAALARSRRHIETHQRRYIPRGLAGHRLICVGEYANLLSQLPSGMLTDEEAEEVRDFGEHNEESDGSPSLWAYASEHFDRRSNYDLRNPNTSFQERVQECAWAMPQRWRLGDWILVMGVVCYPKRWPWALCNLVKREYMREQAAMQLCETLPSKPWRPWDSKRPGFWHFLLANICCSYSSSYAMTYQGNDLANGRWAGDRFAITGGWTTCRLLRPAKANGRT